MPLDARSLQSSGTMNTARVRPGVQASSRDLARWMSDAMAESAVAMPPRVSDDWTPQRAGEHLVEALRWTRYATGRVGPAGMVGMRLPDAFLTDEEFLEQGWGIRETADDPADLPPVRIQLSARQVSRHEAALTWPAVYLVGAGMQGSARMLGLWAACKAYGRPFSRAIDGRGISRPAAYALRDKGLSLISQGLTRDRVPVDL